MTPANERLLADPALAAAMEIDAQNWHRDCNEEDQMDVHEKAAIIRKHITSGFKAAIESGYLGHKYGCTNYTSWNDKPCSCGFTERWGWLTEQTKEAKK